jgi:hypothetical protein
MTLKDVVGRVYHPHQATNKISLLSLAFRRGMPLFGMLF